MAAHHRKAGGLGNGGHGGGGLSGNQTAGQLLFFGGLLKLPPVVLPPDFHRGALHQIGVFHQKGNPVRGLDLVLFQRSRHVGAALGVLQRFQADFRQRFCFAKVFHPLPEKPAFWGGFRRKDYTVFFRQQIALVRSVGKASDIGAAEEVSLVHPHSGKASVSGQTDKSLDGFLCISGGQHQVHPPGIVVQSFQHRAPPPVFSTRGSS